MCSTALRSTCVRRSPEFFAAKQFALASLLVACAGLAQAQVSGAYKVTNLVSDGSVSATVTDPNFINPWAISDSGTWWIATANTGYDYAVSTVPAIGFKVIVPSATNPAANGFPAGSVTTTGASGMILPNGTKASFLFSTLDGSISGWNSKLGTANAICQIVVNNNSAGASYPGLAVLNTSATTSYVLAANFGTGNAIEVYDSTFKKASLAGSFTDPTLPAGYAPFSVRVLNNQVYVAYALRTSAAPYAAVNGPGNGAVSVFDTSGNFVARIATGGNLDSPWGVAIAPANFGIFGGDILIGNFGNGMIHAYDPKSYNYLGQLNDGTGKPLTYASLWELLPGGTTVGNSTSVSGGDVNTVYFTAGLANEQHGLFGAISNDTSLGTPTFGMSASTGALTVAAGSSVSATISVAPTYGFAGTVNFGCSQLPFGASCSFSPSQVTAVANAPATTKVTISTLGSMARNSDGVLYAGLQRVWALLLPFGGLAAWRLRRQGAAGSPLRMLVLSGILFASLGALAACGSPSVVTPPGTNQVMVIATSGSISQSTTLSVTVQ